MFRSSTSALGNPFFEVKEITDTTVVESDSHHPTDAMRETWEEVDQITQSAIETAEAVVGQATSTIEKLQDKGRQAIQQTKQRLTSAMELTTKLVNLFRSGSQADQEKQAGQRNGVWP